MSEEDVQVVRSVFAAFEAGVASGEPLETVDLGSNFHADAEWLVASETPGPTHFRGRDGFFEFMRTWTEDWQTWSLRLERLVDAGAGRVVAIVHQSAVGKASGAPVEARTGLVFDLEDGRVIRMQNYLDPKQALEAAGVPE